MRTIWILAAMAAPMLAAAPIEAQRLGGMVAEQGTLAPAAQAVVSVFRVGSAGDLEPVGTTVTDGDGVFGIALPGAGVYRAQADIEGLSSPMSSPMEVEAGAALDDLALLVPSRLLLMAYSCPDEGAGAVVVGTILDPLEEMPVPSAVVRARWEAGGGTAERTGEADSSGRFRLCDVPAGAVEFRAELLGAVGAWSTVEIPRPMVVMHDVELSLERGETGAYLAYQTAVQERIMLEAAARGLGDLSGEIVDGTSGRPVPDVLVGLDDTRFQTVTDASGRFVLSDLPPEIYTVRLQHLGYSVTADEVDVPAGREVFLRMRLAPQAIELEGVEVSVRSAVEELARLTPFRRDIMYGEDMALAEQRGATAVDLLRYGVPGLRVLEFYPENGPPQVCVSTNRRTASFQAGAGCAPVQVVIDGVRSSEGPEVLRRFHANDIESIEFLPPSQAQTVYGIGGDTANGVVSIWTRGRGPYVSPLREPPRGR